MEVQRLVSADPGSVKVAEFGDKGYENLGSIKCREILE
jgi:hypothetical protein